MIRHILTVSSGTLASRVLGFARDVMVAALLGAGAVTDAFLVAFQIINVVRRLLTEGALNAALVPAWQRVNAEQGAAKATIFAGRVLGSISVAVLGAGILLGVVMPLVIGMLAPGFVGRATLQMAIDNARLMLPYLAFAGPVTVMMSLLNAQHRFVLAAFSPLLFNIALIAVIAVLLLMPVTASNAALIIAATVGVAGLLQLTTLLLSGRAGSIAKPLSVSFDAPMRALFAKIGPGMVALSGPQLLIVIGAIAASRSPAAVSWLYFANRLIELPLGIVGTALGTVLVPELTRAVRGDDKAALTHAQSYGLELSAGLALPSALGMMVLAQPIVSVLFEHGAFTAADTQATARALTLLALGLPAHVVTKAVSSTFFAREDTKTPLIATGCGLFVAIAATLFAGSATGVAVAISLGAWVTALVLVVRATSTFGFALDQAARRRLPRIALAAFAMWALLWPMTWLVWPWMQDAHLLVKVPVLAALIAVGFAIYVGLLERMGVLNFSVILQRLRRTIPRAKRRHSFFARRNRP